MPKLMELYFNRLLGSKGLFPAFVGRHFGMCLPVLLLMAGSARPGLVKNNIQVISSDRQGFHFIVEIQPQDLTWFSGKDSMMSAYVAVVIGVPHGSRAEVTEAEGRGMKRLSADILKGKNLSKTAHPLTRLGTPTTTRGRQIVNLQIFPLAGTDTYEEVEVKVAFQGGAEGGEASGADPLFDRIFSTVVANYDQFLRWPTVARPAAKVSATQAGPFADQGNWFRISVNTTGLYRLTGAQLEAAGAVLSSFQSSALQLYSGGGLPLEVRNDLPRPEFRQVAIIVNDGGDGQFDVNDYILFFGEAHDRFIYSAQPVSYVNNHYSEHNVYWLYLRGTDPSSRMTTQAGTAGGTAVPVHSKRLHVEQERILRHFNDNTVNDFYSWYWSDQLYLTLYVPTAAVLSTDTASIILKGLSGGSYIDLEVNGVAGLDKQCFSTGCTYRTAALVEGTNEFALSLDSVVTDPGSPPYFDYLELTYTAANRPQNDRLDLTLGRLQGSTRVDVVNDFSSTPLVLNVSDPSQPSVVPTSSVTTDWIRFDADLDSSSFSRFYLTPVAQALTPMAVEPGEAEDLYAIGDRADLLVIAPESFRSALQEYIGYRAGTGYAVKLVSVEDIMDNFAWGLYDPTAIRDFLKYAYEYYPSPAPSAVLLAGDGSFDYVDNLATHAPDFVPVYLHPLDKTSASDDNYVYFGAFGILDSDTSYSAVDRGYDMVCARWPVRTATEIATVTDKIRNYESPSQFGIWRTEITLVADDQYHPLPDTLINDETIHVLQTERLANEHIPAIFNADKIYLWEYPFVNRAKPEVNDAIVKAINDGTLIVNYTGHGNPNVWADEAVFIRTDDMPRLSNQGRLPLVFAASCAIGLFDNPESEGMGEDFLAATNGGAIGVVSATRSVSAGANAQFNQTVFDILLQTDSLSIAESFYAAKLLRQYVGETPVPQINDRKFLYFGGPYTPLATPELDVEFTSSPDSLVALGVTRVSGRVVDDAQSTYGHDGILHIKVYDSEREKTYRLVDYYGNILEEVAYRVSGATIYRGTASISAGAFDFEFVPPLDLGFGGEGAKISVYAQFDEIDAAGIADSIAVSDSIAPSTDTLGPTIEVAFVGRQNFVSGDFINAGDQMQVTISDPSGVNLAGAIGHGITAEIDYRPENLINLTPLYEAALDDYTTGSLIYTLGELEPGNHHFKLKAWDNANNSSSYDFDASVLASDRLAIRDLLNYPNPMGELTRFSFYLTQRVEKFSLELYTLSGKKIKSFHRYSLDPGFYDDIEWYGRDADGNRVATEVYIYKATAYPADGGGKVESFGKLVLIN